MNSFKIGHLKWFFKDKFGPMLDMKDQFMSEKKIMTVFTNWIYNLLSIPLLNPPLVFLIPISTYNKVFRSCMCMPFLSMN